MATHSSILAWKILWTEELGGLQSMRSQIVMTEYSFFLSALQNQRQSDKSTDETPRNHDSPLVTIGKHNTGNGSASRVASEG